MKWYSWWARTSGSEAEHSTPLDKKGEGRSLVALVVGITGIVGTSLAEMLTQFDAPGGSWKVYGVARRSQPDWFGDVRIEYVQCDVLNEADVAEKIKPLKDVTHLFWVAWVSRNTEEENCLDNGKMFDNVVNALLCSAPKLQHICLQTGAKHYVEPSSGRDWKIGNPAMPFREDSARLPVRNFYYTLEDILFDAAKSKEGLTWSVHRPCVIFGFSPRSSMNLLGSIAVYAAICKHEGMQFQYPGSSVTWEHFTTASDAMLIAEQQIWASIDPDGKNQTLNVANGDVYNYKRIWSILADNFGLQVPPYNGQPISLVELMKNKEAVWEKIVQKHGLIPTKLEQVGNWWFVDIVLGRSTAPVTSMNKSKQLGFMGFRDTEASALYWIDRMRRKKIIP